MVIGPTILNKIWPQIWPQLSPWPQPRKWHSEFLESLSNANWSWPNFYKPKFQVLAPSVENKCLLTRALCTVQTVDVWWFYFSPIWNNISRSRAGIMKTETQVFHHRVANFKKGHNSEKFQARSSRFCIVIHLDWPRIGIILIIMMKIKISRNWPIFKLEAPDFVSRVHKTWSWNYVIN